MDSNSSPPPSPRLRQSHTGPYTHKPTPSSRRRRPNSHHFSPHPNPTPPSSYTLASVTQSMDAFSMEGLEHEIASAIRDDEEAKVKTEPGADDIARAMDLLSLTPTPQPKNQEADEANGWLSAEEFLKESLRLSLDALQAIRLSKRVAKEVEEGYKIRRSSVCDGFAGMNLGAGNSNWGASGSGGGGRAVEDVVGMLRKAQNDVRAAREGLDWVERQVEVDVDEVRERLLKG